MSSQNSNTKTLFKSAAKNAGKFLSGLFNTQDMGPNPQVENHLEDYLKKLNLVNF